MQRRRNGSTTSLGAGRGRRAGQGGWVGRGMGGAGELRVPGARRRASPSARTCHNVWGLTAQTLLPAQTWCHAPRGAGAPGVVNKAQRAGVRACTKQTGDGGTGCRPLHLPPPPPPAPTRCAMASRSSGIIGRRKVPLSAGVRLCPMGSVMFSNTSSGLHALRWGWGWGQEAGRGVGWLHRAPMWARPTAARHALVDPVDLPPPAHPSPAPWPHQQGHNLALLLLQVIAHHGGQPPERRLRLRQQLGLGGGALGCQGPGPEV